MIRNFDELRAAVTRPSAQKLAVAAATDRSTLEAVAAAHAQGIIAGALLYGDRDEMGRAAEAAGVDLSPFDCRDASSVEVAAAGAVAAVRSGEATVYMKGYLHTTAFLRAALDRSGGLRAGHALSHVFLLDSRRLGRMLMVTDGAINIAPDLAALAQITSNAAALARLLGNPLPKVAVLSAVAAVKPTMQATLDAACLSKMAERGQIKGCVVDGPFALDNAVSAEAAAYKKLSGPVAGQADILVVPDLTTGNVLAKAFPHIAGGEMAGIVMGATAPIVLPSRSDSLSSKLMGIVTAVVIAQQAEQMPLQVQTVHY